VRSPSRAHSMGWTPSRIAVWGTSFAGGHALVTAARVPGVAAAVCQCPMMDGLAAVRQIASYAGLGQVLRLTVHACGTCASPRSAGRITSRRLDGPVSLR